MKLSRHLVLLALALTFCSGTVLAQQKIVIKLGWATSDAPQDNFAMGARAFKSALEETAKGAFDVQLYPNRQIGD